MEIKASWVKGLVIGGIIVISLAALLIDFQTGEKIALIGIGGLIGLSKGE